MITYVPQIRKMLENMGVVRRPNRWSTGTFVAGLVIGAAVAAAMTPADGKELRKLLQSKAKRFAGSAEKKIAAFKSHRANGTRERLHA